MISFEEYVKEKFIKELPGVCGIKDIDQLSSERIQQLKMMHELECKIEKINNSKELLKCNCHVNCKSKCLSRDGIYQCLSNRRCTFKQEET